MALYNELEQALIAADKAGNSDDVRVIMGELDKLKNQTKALGYQYQQPERVDPTEGMSGMQLARAGAGKGMTDIGRGLGQLVGAVSMDDINRSRKEDAPLMQTGGGRLGNIGGTVVALAPTAFIPGANTVTGATLIGGATGALTTPGTFEERRNAGLMGAAGGFLGQMIPKGINSLRAAAEPLTDAGRAKIIGRVMNSAAGENADEVVGRLRSASPIVPGSNPTAAEVANSGGISALQRSMSAANPEAYAHRGMEQASARVNALRTIAGDEGQREMFDAMRKTTAQKLYEEAYAKGVDLAKDAATGQFLSKAQQAGRKAEITKLMNTPAMQQAAEAAKNLAKNEMVRIDNPAGSVQGLDYMRRALSDQIKNAQGNEQRVLIGLRDRLDTTLNTISPKYAEARATFAEMSKPINQIDVGKTLLDKLQGPLADHGALASETGSMYARALRNEGEAAARSATGMKQGLSDVLSPEQMKTVTSVAQDLARKANAQDLGRGVGSNTFQNFAMDNLAQTMGVPSAVKSLAGVVPGLSPTATLIAKGARAATGLAYKHSDEIMRQQIAQALLNPQVAADLMSKASQPTLIARAINQLPPSVVKQLPPQDVIKLLQAMPGVTGAAVGSAYATQ